MRPNPMGCLKAVYIDHDRAQRCTGRTTTLHGAIHLGVFVMFLLIAAVP